MPAFLAFPTSDRREPSARARAVVASSCPVQRLVADAEGLPAELRVANYLVDDLGREHDAALLLYEDFCALSPAQRGGLLRRTREALRPGGAFVMDVTAAPRFATEHPGARHERDLDGAGGETRARRDLLHPHRRWSVSGS
ncbi:hypothetical protein GCM10009774_07020 [Cellulomonas gelida]|uniref:Methyltransferase type 11 domain-containing protein n=1 Tax=Cellulomonas gelida TaxID=1712 RepID=A0A4Y3KM30_9CELL|nr:hypothetical protein CGE01nite_14460 [Cellulomonas gelida]GGL19300.1 hypothetical protein GCM10009774_07020 [Cellulomonas gelida]